MLQIKKYPDKSMLLIGLVLALFMTYVSIEHKTYDRIVQGIQDVVYYTNSSDIPEEVIAPNRVIIPAGATPPPPPPSMEIIEIVKNNSNSIESVLISTETNQSESVITSTAVPVSGITEQRIAEEILEDVPFAVIETSPVFPGCKGTNEQLRDCFSKSISDHVNKNFDVGLAQGLNLEAGRKKIFVMFTINSKGKIIDILSRAPHPKLEQEAERVIKSLPTLTPGKQRNHPVNVKYALPITFEVVI
jgi:periplasmic protein TonB